MTELDPDVVLWLRQWQAAGPELEAMRDRELRELSDEDALAAAESLLSMAAAVPLPEARLTSSGLVAQQQAFLSRRRS